MEYTHSVMPISKFRLHGFRRLSDAVLDSLGDLERKTLEQIRRLGESNVSTVCSNLDRSYAYTTVMTVMTRMTQKGLLSRKQVGRSHKYRVKVKEEQFRERTARVLAQRLVQGFDHIAIASFVEEVAKVGPDRLKELEDLVKQASQEQ